MSMSTLGNVRSLLATRMMAWANTHPERFDDLFAVAMGLATMVGYLTVPLSGSERSADVGGALIVVGQTIAFAFRRRRPLTSAAAVILLTATFWVSDYASGFDAFSLLALYAATAHGGADRVRVWRVVGSLLAVVTAIAIAGVVVASEDLPAAAVIGIAVIHLTAAIVGEVVFDRRMRLVSLEQRAERAEAERELLGRQAVLDERTRIARDLHDIVAHGMSVMVVQAGAAERIVATDPDAAVAALGHIQRAGREALAEMRRMLDVLRDGQPRSPDLTPQPGLDDIEQVVRHCTEAGIATELRVDGEPPAASVGQEMTAYRIVQEALTNTIKHAGRPTSALVKVRYRTDHIAVEVLDDGEGTTDSAVANTTGHGFVGMRERVDLYGGSLAYGPRPGGGFRVAATVPLNAIAAS